MARLLRPVMKIISVMPAAAASSTAYWISGLSTMGSISFGLAFVTGRNRLPSPATGNTAFVTLRNVIEEFLQLSFIENRHAEVARTIELRPGVFAGDDEMGLLRNAAAHLAAVLLDQRTRILARQVRQRAGEHEALAGQFPERRACRT